MAISPLAKLVLISPNSSVRKSRVDKITVHHMAAVLSAETCGAIFQNTARQASSNYGIGNDGTIACYVDEDRQAWTSSNYDNDQRAVTIETSNSATGGDWPVSDAAWKSLVALCVDICRRNGIKKLNWTGDASGNLTIHQFFAATACPGPYLKSRMQQLADEVNSELGIVSGSWVKDPKGWWFKYAGGGYPKNTWKKIGGSWFYFDSTGYALENEWKKINGIWYWFKPGCYAAQNECLLIKGKWYAFDDNCHMKTSVKVDKNGALEL